MRELRRRVVIVDRIGAQLSLLGVVKLDIASLISSLTALPSFRRREVRVDV